MTQHQSDDAKELMRQLYPDLSEEELKDARDNIRGYLAAVLRIHDRLEREDHSPQEPHLTSDDGDDGMEDERSTKH